MPRPTLRAVMAATAIALFAGCATAMHLDGRSARNTLAAQPAAAEAVAAAPSTTTPSTAAAEQPVEAPLAPAYRVASTDGGIFTHGSLGFAGSAVGATPSEIVGLAQTDTGDGYWLASADGGVFAFGKAAFLGSVPGQTNAPIVDIAVTPSHGGYWLASADGGVFAFGDAGFVGAAVDGASAHPIVSVASTASGNGYWLVAADGGVFAYGDAPFFGSLSENHVNASIIDLVPSASGAGYYLVSSDGGVFAYGDAEFYGSAAEAKLNRPVVDMTLNPAGPGYWLLAADGGVFAYGGAPFLGAPLSEQLSAPATAIVGGLGPATPAQAEAEAAAAPAPAPAPAQDAGPAVAAAAVSAVSAAAPSGRLLDGLFGWDISYPQCGGPRPDARGEFAIIGVTGGRAFKYNRCLAEEWAWARQTAAGIYLNVNFPRTPEELAAGETSDRQPTCNGGIACVAYNFGLNGVRDSLDYARGQGVDVPFVWLDVETVNYWSPSPELNAVVIRGAIDAASERGLGAGLYSTPYQFGRIAGAETPRLPVWTAGAPGFESGPRYCAEKGFGGGPVVLVQFLPGQFDPNIACPGAGPLGRYFKLP